MTDKVNLLHAWIYEEENQKTALNLRRKYTSKMYSFLSPVLKLTVHVYCIQMNKNIIKTGTEVLEFGWEI